jgi:hypothetical protein
LAPLAVGAKYTIDIATDLSSKPSVLTASKNTELIPLETFVSNESRSFKARWFSVSGLGLVVPPVTMILSFLAGRFIGRRLKPRLQLAGRLVSAAGNPVSGAQVTVRLFQPLNRAHDYPVTTTDKSGEFYLKTSKAEVIRGTIYVEHPDYAPFESDFSSPLIFVNIVPRHKSQPVDDQICEAPNKRQVTGEGSSLLR